MSRFVKPPVRAVPVVGGDSVAAQFSSLANTLEVAIVTPGWLTHLLSKVADLTLGDLDTVVYNESDRLFEMGFVAQVRCSYSYFPCQHTFAALQIRYRYRTFCSALASTKIFIGRFIFL